MTLLLIGAKVLALIGGFALIAAVWYELEPEDRGRVSERWLRRNRGEK